TCSAAAGTSTDCAALALLRPKSRGFFALFSFFSTIAGALLVPGAGNRATPPGNPRAINGPWPFTANPLRSHAFCCKSSRDSQLPGSETGKLNLGDQGAARITVDIIARLASKPSLCAQILCG